MRRLPLSLAVAMTCALFQAGAASGQVFNQQPGQGPIRVQARPMQACAADYMRLCRGVPPGGGRIISCLNAHADALSQPCFQALALRGLASASALKACRVDYERMCAQAGPGLRGLACLMDNAQALNPTCRDALARQGLFEEERELREFRR